MFVHHSLLQSKFSGALFKIKASCSPFLALENDQLPPFISLTSAAGASNWHFWCCLHAETVSVKWGYFWDMIGNFWKAQNWHSRCFTQNVSTVRNWNCNINEMLVQRVAPSSARNRRGGGHETSGDPFNQHGDCSFCLLWKSWWYRITFSLSAVKFLFSNLVAWKGNSFLMGSGYGWSVTNSMCNMLPVTCPSVPQCLSFTGVKGNPSHSHRHINHPSVSFYLLSVSPSLEINSACSRVMTPSHLSVPTSNSGSPSWFVEGNSLIR